MNETPPLPQPSGATCPNCGAAQSASTKLCTNCGMGLRAATPSGSLSQSAKIISSLALGCGALMFGVLGGCFMMLGLGDTSGLGWLTFAITALGVLGFLVGIFLILRKK